MTLDDAVKNFRSLKSVNRTVDYKATLRRTMTIEETDALNGLHL